MESCPQCGRPYGVRRRCYWCTARPRAGTMKTCETCGTGFYSEPGGGDKSIFCSKACMTVGMRRRYEDGWVDRFWARAAKGDGCWEWRGPRNPKGYGYGSIRSKTQNAHRIAWEIVNGPIPPGHVIRHACDNTSCVNPAHLLLGTHRDNMADMATRGRAARGSANGNSRERRAVRGR